MKLKVDFLYLYPTWTPLPTRCAKQKWDVPFHITVGSFHFRFTLFLGSIRFPPLNSWQNEMRQNDRFNSMFNWTSIFIIPRNIRSNAGYRHQRKIVLVECTTKLMYSEIFTWIVLLIFILNIESFQNAIQNTTTRDVFVSGNSRNLISILYGNHC